MKCGGGPAIKIKDSSIICHPKIKNLLINSAKTLDIQYQLEILERGGNDTGAIHLSGGGVPSGAISLPCRYIHSPVETVSIKDVKNASKLLSQALIQF